MDTSWIELWARLAILLVAIVCGSAIAAAQGADPSAEAAREHDRGLVLYRSGDFSGAAQAFEAAQALAPAPSNLFNLSRCYERTGDIARAVATLEQYVASDVPEERLARGRAELERLRAAGAVSAGAADAEEIVEIALVSDPPGAAVFVDGRPLEGVVTSATLRLEPGVHMIEVRLEGHESVRQEVIAEAGRSQVVQLTLIPGEPSGHELLMADAPRLAWTGAVQVNAGAAFPLAGADALGVAALLGLELSAGLRLGRPQLLRGRPWRPVRLELILGVVGEVGGSFPLLEATGGGRLSVALGALPIRVEGELSLGFTLVAEESVPVFGFALIPGFSVVYQALHWLEIALRPARLELLWLGDAISPELEVRWGLDVLVRFRI